MFLEIDQAFEMTVYNRGDIELLLAASRDAVLCAATLYSFYRIFLDINLLMDICKKNKAFLGSRQSVPCPGSISVYGLAMMTKSVKLWQLFSRSLGLLSLLELIWIPCSCSRALFALFTKQPITMEQRLLDLTVRCMFPVKNMGSL